MKRIEKIIFKLFDATPNSDMLFTLDLYKLKAAIGSLKFTHFTSDGIILKIARIGALFGDP